MNDKSGGVPGSPGCGEVRDLLPLRNAEALDDAEVGSLQLHLRDCSECKAEAEFLETIALARPEPPATLRPSVLGRLRVDEFGISEAKPSGWDVLVQAWRTPPRRIAGWTLSAAAVVVLALGIGVLWSDDPMGDGELLLTSELLAAETEMPDEWMVAGAPVLDGLPDEVLLSLLTEVDR